MNSSQHKTVVFVTAAVIFTCLLIALSGMGGKSAPHPIYTIQERGGDGKLSAKKQQMIAEKARDIMEEYNKWQEMNIFRSTTGKEKLAI